MPAYPRPGEDAAAEAEAASWAKAFGAAVPAPPLTAEEKRTLLGLMVRAKETGREDLLDRLAAFESDPIGFRAFARQLADDPADSPTPPAG